MTGPGKDLSRLKNCPPLSIKADRLTYDIMILKTYVAERNLQIKKGFLNYEREIDCKK
jgi:hypothetical protein